MWFFVIYVIWLAFSKAMSTGRIAELRQETIEMFYHGFDNYMNIAFPEDELRPVTCVPLTRDQQNPRNVELNDVLGNYSLTLIDSLSTLAILASSPLDDQSTAKRALRDFQNGVASLVLYYGDGTEGPDGEGLRARGFDVDSKVQVFETVIRGVGGLLSAHLFAVGELPITSYHPKPVKVNTQFNFEYNEKVEILWANGFKYNGQLLRLALDLGKRLLPAFYTATGIPYPRVNLRHGTPFYLNSRLQKSDKPLIDHTEEVTETCSAGAGTLVLEFTVLSRLTNDPRFEQLAKRAFWAIWDKRSSIGLLGAGIDAESGQWIGSYSGIGAGTDSFLEYALKAHILLSGRENANFTASYLLDKLDDWLDPNTIFHPLTEEENSSAAFLNVWHEAHAAVKRHLYSSTHHPHYVNVHLSTGSPQAYWIDSLSAYYPGLLAIAGEIDEATETNLLYTALWTRYSALPERWSVRDGRVEDDLGWWPGRPEFIETNYHLYQATRDPWYLYVGEMVLKDIKRRCYTTCGWSGLQDVRTGEKSDRMESFFLGETAKYLYLLFDPDHPLNTLDAAYVFTTEGHPLIIPFNGTPKSKKEESTSTRVNLTTTCPVPPMPIPFTVSVTAARRDISHASSLIGLHLIPNYHLEQSGITPSDPSVASLQKASNYLFYPWTLPETLMPVNGICDPLPQKNTFTIEFPATTPLHNNGDSNSVVFGPQNLLRVPRGILVKSLSGLKLGLVHETQPASTPNESPIDSWRVWDIANIPLGRDEQVFISRDILGETIDPSFTRVRDPLMLDLVIQLDTDLNVSNSADTQKNSEERDSIETEDDLTNPEQASEYKILISSFFQSFTSILSSPTPTPTVSSLTQQMYHTSLIPAILPSGIGAAPLPDIPEVQDPESRPRFNPLSWTTFSFVGEGCNEKIEDDVPQNHHIVVIRRGGCSFSEKLANIPSFAPTSKSLQLVIVISGESDEDGEIFDSPENGNKKPTMKTDVGNLIRPLLDKDQLTPSGLVRHNQIAMVMVDGGLEVENLLRHAKSLGLRRRYYIESHGHVIANIILN